MGLSPGSLGLGLVIGTIPKLDLVMRDHQVLFPMILGMQTKAVLARPAIMVPKELQLPHSLSSLPFGGEKNKYPWRF